MSEDVTPGEIARLIRDTDTRLELLLARLSVEQMNQPGAVGVWSVKDVLAHIAFWERQKASAVAQYYLRPLALVIADWQAAREELLEQIERLSMADLHDPYRFPWSEGQSLSVRIAGNSYEHE